MRIKYIERDRETEREIERWSPQQNRVKWVSVAKERERERGEERERESEKAREHESTRAREHESTRARERERAIDRETERGIVYMSKE